MTRHFAVVGDPITQSLSPKIHAAAYKALGLGWDYQAFTVSSGELKSFIDSHQDLSGLSVTMPLKFEAAELSEPSDEPSKRLGVVNTLLKDDKVHLGFNTDVFGIQKATDAVKSVQKIAVLGSGATARTAVYAMQKKFPEAEIVLMARNETTGRELSSLFSVPYLPLSTDQIDADLVINTIPGSLFPTTGTTLQASYSVNEDLPTNYISGIEMLLWQAIAQIRIFSSGDAGQELHSEAEVFRQMRLAITNG
jgi:shikimate dehydrogenase